MCVFEKFLFSLSYRLSVLLPQAVFQYPALSQMYQNEVRHIDIDSEPCS